VLLPASSNDKLSLDSAIQQNVRNQNGEAREEGDKL
jgi:hypothetical protein